MVRVSFGQTRIAPPTPSSPDAGQTLPPAEAQSSTADEVGDPRSVNSPKCERANTLEAFGSARTVHLTNKRAIQGRKRRTTVARMTGQKEPKRDSKLDAVMVPLPEGFRSNGSDTASVEVVLEHLSSQHTIRWSSTVWLPSTGCSSSRIALHPGACLLYTYPALQSEDAEIEQNTEAAVRLVEHFLTFLATARSVAKSPAVFEVMDGPPDPTDHRPPTTDHG